MPCATVVGGGLAGCEAAWQLAEHGIRVRLLEMKPRKYSPAHHYSGLAELVCSNSLKAARLDSAAGLLKEEMRRLGSLTVPVAMETAVEAGGALAVDRERFSDGVTRRIRSHPQIEVVEEEAVRLPEGPCVIATGPLTSEGLAEALRTFLERESLSFYDAAAPIVAAESVNREIAFSASRYDRGDGYLNCPMDREEYQRFYEALRTGERAPLKDFDKENFSEMDGLPVYEGCMPIEVMAQRGADTIRYGPLKPVGLRDPRTGHRPWAVVQLRRENAEGSLYNLVGFQTNLKFGEQKRIFSLIPGLERAEFVRYGVMHRNTFLDSPRLLDGGFRLKKDGRYWFAGQLTGVEGYMESAASGILAGMNLARWLTGREPLELPRATMLGALAAYVSDPYVKDFQPMGANMGILPPLEEPVRDKKLRYQRLAERSLEQLEQALREAGERPMTDSGKDGSDHADNR